MTIMKHDLKIHVGQNVDNPGDVAIAIAPADVSQEDLATSGLIIALHPSASRDVATRIMVATEAAESYRRHKTGEQVPSPRLAEGSWTPFEHLSPKLWRYDDEAGSEGRIQDFGDYESNDHGRFPKVRWFVAAGEFSAEGFAVAESRDAAVTKAKERVIEILIVLDRMDWEDMSFSPDGDGS